MSTESSIKKLGLFSVISFVIANMVGTGVFTSLGFQLSGGVSNIYSVLALWLVGGIIAFFGALVYGELGSTMPRSGGEYHYLSKIYHPSVGFLSGWVSVTVGFSAPVAAACMAMAAYVGSIFPEINTVIFAAIVLTVITLVHSFSVTVGKGFQNFFTIFKVLFIVILILCGLFLTPETQPLIPDFQSFSFSSLFTPAFAVSLVFVTYAFSGWNAAGYIAGEIKNPQKNLPKSLFISTLFVTVLYLGLNFVFLYAAPKAELIGNPEVGLISAKYIFGNIGGTIMGGIISILLISTISAMVFVGPRVSKTMGEDYKILKFLSFQGRLKTPIVAIWFQFLISFILILTSKFDEVITYAGFTLNLFTLLAVIGIFVHRYKFPNIERPYKTWGYPVVPILFGIIVTWISVYLLIFKTTESLWGLLTMALGLVFYFINHLLIKHKPINH